MPTTHKVYLKERELIEERTPLFVCTLQKRSKESGRPVALVENASTSPLLLFVLESLAMRLTEW
jgi:hypothetical protein